MKKVPGKDGTRLWFEEGEIDGLMEAELHAARLMPTLDRPVVDIEGFIEFHLKAQLDFSADLDADTLGETEFRIGAPPIISINKDLTAEALDDPDSPLSIRGRWRATAAHEAGHVIVHACLFDLNPSQRTLFGDSAETPREKRLQRCLRRDVAHHGVPDWREFQANACMAALLMPRPLFTAAFAQEVEQRGLGRVDRGSAHVRSLAATLAARFEVSKQAASIRMETLKLLAQPGQTDLTE
jgi:hypothetical protein